MKHIIASFILALILSGCSFQPNDAEGITLGKVTDDTLSIGIIDSYHVIKKYRTQQVDDTLFINVESISSNNKYSPIRIYVNKNINYVKLQNDRLFNIDSIPLYD